MEFSFDRSKDSQLRNTTQPKPEVKPEPVAAQPAESYDDGIDTSTIQNERLRKAIERNRARQAERARLRPEPVQAAPRSEPHYQPPLQAQIQPQPQPEPQAEVQPEPVQEQASLFSARQAHAQAQAQAQHEAVEESVAEPQPAERPRTERAQLRSTPRSSAVVTRRSVARPDETDFTPAAKRQPRKVASQISYSTSGSKKKSKPLDPNLVGYLVKGCWIFCGIMILRLIFANGGVTDFYSRKSILNDRLSELDRIKKENMQLVREIERMQTDTAFQKRLVRDNLGFIAADEFLILFPKEKSIQ